MFSYYTSPPIDPILKVWMFNYTNIDDVLNGSAKIIKLDEIGPYVYRERIEKTGIDVQGQLITFRVSFTFKETNPRVVSLRKQKICVCLKQIFSNS